MNETNSYGKIEKLILSRNEKQTIERLEYLSKMISKYSHRWVGENTSNRMFSWVDEYNFIKDLRISEFKKYCDKNGIVFEHNGYDCLA